MMKTQEFVRFLGQGSYGRVDLVRFTYSDGYSFPLARKTSDKYYSLEKEIQVLTELSGYPNIVQCFGNELEQSFDLKGNRVYSLLLEYASEGCLSDFMDKFPDRKLPAPMIRVFTSMILEGLVRIHGHGYVHCDLKSDNLLVFPLSDDDAYELKISDFGSVLEVGDVPDYWAIDFPFVGTPNYMPPESLRNGVADKTLDLWSLGCLVLEMFTGVEPWNGVRIRYLKNLLLDGKSPEIPEGLPCDAREFIETCFSRKPEDRGSAIDLLSHRFLCLDEEEEKIVSDVTVLNEIEKSLVSDFVVVKEIEETEDKTVLDFVIVEEEKESAEKIVSDVCVVDKSKRLSLLMLKLRIRRALKKPKIFGSKPSWFKKFFDKLLKLKSLNSMDSNLVFVH